jgi:HNH endonuclease
MAAWEDLEERFRKKVRVAGPDECWEWIGARYPLGYGVCWSTDHKKAIRTHRYVFEQMIGPIPPGLYVLHRCDMPACVNPRHLFLGTQGTNRRDCIRKGRNGKRENYGGGSKLQRHQVEMIRAIYAEMDIPRRRHLARLYGISEGLVQKVITREVWGHV